MQSIYGTVAGLNVHKKTLVVVLLESEHPDESLRRGYPELRGIAERVDRVSSETWSDALGGGIDGPVLYVMPDGLGSHCYERQLGPAPFSPQCRSRDDLCGGYTGMRPN